MSFFKNYTLNEHLSDAIIGSVHDVFLALLAMEVFPGSASEVDVIPGSVPGERDDGDMLTILIGFAGDLEGTLRISCALPIALALARSLSGHVFTTQCVEVYDALARLSEKIAGGVQVRVSPKGCRGLKIYQTPPTVVSGRCYRLNGHRLESYIKQVFQMDVGLFVVECLYLKISQKFLAGLTH